MSNELARADNEVSGLEALPVAALVEQVRLIQDVMSQVMHDGEHYGIIPGTSRKDKDGREMAKPTLLKPGAEKLGFVFRLAPEFTLKRTDLPGGHREYEVVCRLTSINTGAFVGSGVGSCSTLEKKYRYRSGRRKCPACGAETIIQTKKGRNPGGYWCVPDKGGCGANFDPGDPAVENQAVGQTENPDMADTYNTVLKMAKKRAHVDAILTATAASDIFTQDVEDFPRPDVVEPAAVESAPPRQAAKAPAAPKQAPAELPNNGPELVKWLARMDRFGADKHWYESGKLHAHVMHHATEQLWQGIPETWEADHIREAIDVAREFMREREAFFKASKKPVPEVTSA